MEAILSCPICQEYSEQPHQLHYGGIACFSCRAFFRRAHQKTKTPNFKCKKNNACEVTVKTRRKCQKCRYNLCLRQGMKPEAVLTDDQKKVRFRNSIKKKETLNKSTPLLGQEYVSDEEEMSPDEGYDDPGSQSSSSTIMAPPTPMASSIPSVQYPTSTRSLVASSTTHQISKRHMEQPSLKRPKLNGGNELSTLLTTEDQILISKTESSSNSEAQQVVFCQVVQIDMPGPPYSFLLDKAGDPPCPVGTSIVKKLIDCFMFTCNQTALVEDTFDFSKELLSYHQGERIMTRKSFFRHLRTLGSQFRHFAIINKDFVNLSKDDQRKLLARNTPLYIQYMLARYITGETGFEQLEWMLGVTLPKHLSSDEKVNLRKVSLKKLVKHLNLFHLGANIDNYAEFAKRLNIRGIGYKCTAVWCHLILFQTDNNVKLDDAAKVHQLSHDAQSICPHSAHVMKCVDKPNVPAMIHTAEAMARFFAQNVIWIDVGKDGSPNDPLSNADSSSNPSPPSDSSSSDHGKSPNFDLIALQYGQDEEKWLQGQLKKFDVAWNIVGMGEELMKEFIMYSYDVPLSKHFMLSSMNVFNERFRHILKMHPEFMALSDAQQNRMWAQNLIYGSAMNFAKLETCETGNEQHYFATGFPDRQTYLDGIMNNQKLKKLEMTVANKESGFISQDFLANFNRLVTNIGEVIQNVETFKLFTLVLLFSDVEDIPSILKLRNCYLNVIRRRNHHLLAEASGANDLAFGSMVYSRFNACVCDVKELAMIVRKLKPPA